VVNRRGKKSNERWGIQPPDWLIKSQLLKSDNHNQNKDLPRITDSTYKAVYKQYQKTAQNQPENLPDGLAEIVAVWPKSGP